MAVLWFAIVSCRETTQITVSFETDVPCTEIKSFSYSAASLTDIDQKKAKRLTAGTFTCEKVGDMNRLGTLAVVPDGAIDQKVAIVAAIQTGTADVDASAGHACIKGTPGCVFQRVLTEYVLGRTARLTMQLRQSCAGVSCAGGQTCFTQACQNDEVSLVCTMTNCVTTAGAGGGNAASGGGSTNSGGGSANSGGGSTNSGGGSANSGGGSTNSGGGVTNSGGGSANSGGGSANSGGGGTNSGGGVTNSGGGSTNSGGGSTNSGGGSTNSGGGSTNSGGGSTNSGGGTAVSGGGTSASGGGVTGAGGGGSMSGGGTVATGGGATGPQLLLSPMGMISMSAAVGTAATVQIIVSNTGGTAANSLGFSLSGSAFSLSSIAANRCVLGQSLLPGAICTLNVVFTPSVNVVYLAGLTVSSTGLSNQNVNIIGTGLNPALLAAGIAYPLNSFTGRAQLRFGNSKADVPVVGTLGAATVFVVKNIGDVASTPILTVLSGGDFIITSDACNGTSLAAGASCTVGLTYRAQPIGPSSRTLSATAAQGGTFIADLTGKSMWELVLIGPGSGVGTIGDSLQCLQSSGNCTKLYDDQTSLTVQAKGLNSMLNRFDNWGFGTTPSAFQSYATGSKVTFNITSHSVFAPLFKPYTARIAFTSSTIYPMTSPNGIVDFDNQCNALANAAGLNNGFGNGFKVLRSTVTESAATHLTVPGIGGTIIRPDGEIVAQSGADLFGNAIRAPMSLNEYGGRITQGPGNNDWSVVTASTATGAYDGQGDCGGWTTAAGVRNPGNFGQCAGGPSVFTTGSAVNGCSGINTRLYCIQVVGGGTILPLNSIPSGGKLVFATAVAYRPAVDGSPDSFCNLPANKPTGSSIFKALIAGVGTTAIANASVVATTKYYRLDGIFVGTGTEIANSEMRAGIWLTGQSGFLPGSNRHAWGGAMATGLPGVLTGTTASTCNNWSSDLGTVNGGIGNVNSSNRDFLSNGSTIGCNSTTAHLYCVEQ
jgi:hypothetical protein